jgi:predicted ATPase
VDGDLAAFREAVRQRRRAAGRTQQQLARGVGLHPDVLSHKLHARGALLTSADVTAILTTLAGWGAVGSQAEARTLLALMGLPPQAVPPGAWADGPLGALPPGDPDSPPIGPQQDGEPGPEPGGGGLSPAPLPSLLTPLVGREAEVAEVAAAVAERRLVTLTGTGGTGKTRVALQAARELAGRFADGVAFADLAPVGDPGLLAVALARAVGLQPPSPSTTEGQLAAALRPARLLLVADNMEHLVEQAPLLARLLAAAPGLYLLVTSRIPLGLYGEHLLRVPPLGLPSPQVDPACSEAVRLFTARAQAVAPGFDPHGDDLGAVAAICTALDGLPLAIELAAAQVRLYPPQALLPRLRQRLPLLTRGPHDLPRRQQTLRATLEWSEALLPPAERALFARLGVFAGPFDAAAAAAVCVDAAPAGDVLEPLAMLGEHGLLEVSPGDPPRFRLLQTIREYALARLAETGQATPMRQRHLRHCLTLATQAEVALYGPDHGSWAARVEADFANVHAALDWAREQLDQAGPPDHAGCLEQALRLATAVASIWQDRGWLAEGTHHLERLLAIDARLGTAAPVTRAWALLQASALACFRGDSAGTTALAAESLALFQALGDLRGQARSHRYLGEAALSAGDYPVAEPHFTAELALARQARDRRVQAEACNMLGQVLRYQGRYAAATTRLRQALRSFQAAGDPDSAATILASLAEVARDTGQPARARSLYQQALRVHQQTGNKRQITYHLEGLAGVAALEHQPRAALVYLGAAQALRETTGGPPLPPEQAILTRLLDPLLAELTPRQRDDALAEGRTRPLTDIIAEALSQPSTKRR